MTLTPPYRFLPVALCLILPSVVSRGPAPLQGQELAQILVDENIRAEPQGVVLGRLLSGTTLPVLSVQDQWVQVLLEGWIWTPSVQTTDRLGFDLRVSVSPNENLRVEPSGTILARLVEGTLLNQAGETVGWTRIQRDVWIWRESVELDLTGSEPGSETPEAPGDPTAGTRWWRSPEGRDALLSAPDGDTLALPRSGTEMRVLAREGNWVRVRLEGWVWSPESEGVEPVEESESPGEATPSQVAADPERYRGRTFSWELQFVSLERAEKIRTDFYEGEPFLLTRVPDVPGLFVYVAVPPDQVSDMAGLIPLERIQVVGRLRTGAAALTGNPILDLLEIARVRGREG